VRDFCNRQDERRELESAALAQVLIKASADEVGGRVPSTFAVLVAT
jgi:hypothetical protein